MPTSRTYSILLLEETFQLLRESLKYCPFNQSNDYPTKKHLTRFKQLLDPEFSFWLAETGSLFFSVLMAAKSYADSIQQQFTPEHRHAKEIYNHLLLISQLTMSIGLHAQRTTEALLQLNELTARDEYARQDIYTVVDDALSQLQTYMCTLITS